MGACSKYSSSYSASDKIMKPTQINLANFYGLTRQTIASYQKVKPRLYTAMVKHFIDQSSRINNEGLIVALWKIIDDIDSYGDMAKSDDKLYRSLVERRQLERWNLPIISDGYNITINEKVVK